MQPLPVEITDHSSLLAQWLPTIGSLVVSLVALGGVIWTNWATNSRTKLESENVRRREFDAWRREKILRVATEAMEVFLGANSLFTEVAYLDEKATPKYFQPIFDASQKIMHVTMVLGLLNFDEGRRLAVGLNQAMSDTKILAAALALNEARNDGDVGGVDDATARFDEVTRPLATAQAAFRHAIQEELNRLPPGKPQK